MADKTMTLSELIQALQNLQEITDHSPVIGDPSIRVMSGVWSTHLVGVELFPNTGHIVLRAGE